MISTDDLEKVLMDHLPQQRWFAGGAGTLTALEVTHTEVLRDEWPLLLHVLAEATSSEAGRSTYQVVLGLRPADSRETFLEGKPEALVGEVDTDLGRAVAYDAAVDAELAICLLDHIAPDEDVARARVMMAEQSNTSVVYDDRLILKLFRRLAEGPNPDAEVIRALADVGFANVPTPVAEWRGDGVDYAVVTQFLAGSVDGFSLALTSLRDLYDRRCPPEEAGGDFAPDARRLGAITAQMHLAMAEAFATTPADPGAWADDMETQLDRVSLDDDIPDRARAVYERLRSATGPGPALRVHGDYHLGQVLRTDAGWFVLDFEGEPNRPLDERRRPSSPLRDVAGILRSLHYAAAVGLREWGQDVDDEIAALAVAWERHNGAAFVAGYEETEGVDAVLPADPEQRRLVRTAFELDKAVYEVGYEQAHRPDWVTIPLAAVRRLLEDA